MTSPQTPLSGRTPAAGDHTDTAEHVTVGAAGSTTPAGQGTRTPSTETDALMGYCPTCGVHGQVECHTKTGRDHPSRGHYAQGWRAASRLVRATPPTSSGGQSDA